MAEHTQRTSRAAQHEADGANSTRAAEGQHAPEAAPSNPLVAADADASAGSLKSRLLPAQRLAMTARIARVHGNQHLQRVMAASATGRQQRGAAESALPPTSAVDPVGDPAIAAAAADGGASMVPTGPWLRRWPVGVTPAPIARFVGFTSIQRKDPKSGGGKGGGLGSIKFAPTEIEADGKSTATGTIAPPPPSPVNWTLGPPDFGSTVDSAGVVTAGSAITKGEKSAPLSAKATDAATPTKFASGALTLWDAEYKKALKDFPKFVGGSYKVAYARGGGKFDATYAPAANTLNAVMKIEFKFLNDTSSFSERMMHSIQSAYDAAAGDAYAAAHGMWTAKDQADYRKMFKDQVMKAWDKRYQFTNIREPKDIWGKLGPVSVNLALKEVGSGGHFVIQVHKKAGRAQVFKGVTDLHPGDEKTQSPFQNKNAQAGELASINKANPSPILFDHDSFAVPAAAASNLSFLADYLRRINVPTIDVAIVGHASAPGKVDYNQKLSEKRAKAVEAILRGAGIGVHVLNVSGVGATGAAAPDPTWRKVVISPSVQKGFVNAFDTIPHEFGHMLGLGDEYKDKGGAAQASHHDLVVKAFGKKYADIAAARGSAPASVGTSSGMMNVGQDVRVQHYVTFWDALVQASATAPVPDKKFSHDDWKFVE